MQSANVLPILRSKENVRMPSHSKVTRGLLGFLEQTIQEKEKRTTQLNVLIVMCLRVKSTGEYLVTRPHY